MTELTKLKISILCLIPITLYIALQLHKIYKEYENVLNPKTIEQKESGYHYKIFTDDDRNGHLIVADFFGFNNFTMEDASNAKDLFIKHHNNIVLERENGGFENLITQESLINAISDMDNIMIADNFCTQNWKNLSHKKLYQNTHISPGSTCLTSKTSLFVDRFIKKHSIKQVTIPYKTTSYLNLLENFIVYLKENNITVHLKKLIS